MLMAKNVQEYTLRKTKNNVLNIKMSKKYRSGFNIKYEYYL